MNVMQGKWRAQDEAPGDLEDIVVLTSADRLGYQAYLARHADAGFRACDALTAEDWKRAEIDAKRMGFTPTSPDAA